jgi:hydrogenase nickel incorporation protein HypA/HybF
MHELSLAQALIQRVAVHVPEGGSVKRVRVRAGAMAAVEPDAMQLAWTAVTQGTHYQQAALELVIEPYRLRCPQCGREWESADLFVECECGYPRPQCRSDSALTLESLDVDVANELEVSS